MPNEFIFTQSCLISISSYTTCSPHTNQSPFKILPGALISQEVLLQV